MMTNNELTFDLEFVPISMEHRSKEKEVGIFNVTLLEFKLGIVAGFNVVSLVFERKDKSKIFLDNIFLDEVTFHGALNVSHRINHQMLALLGVENSEELVADENYCNNLLATELEKSVGTELYLVLTVRLDLGLTSLIYDHTLMFALNKHGQSLREIKHKDFLLRDLLFRKDLVTTLFSRNYLETETRVQMNKNFEDLFQLFHQTLGEENGKTINTGTVLERFN